MSRHRKQSFNITVGGAMAADDVSATGTQKSAKAKQEKKYTLRHCEEHKE